MAIQSGRPHSSLGGEDSQADGGFGLGWNGSAAPDSHLSTAVPGRHDCRWLDHQHDGAPSRIRPVHDAPRDRYPLTGGEYKRPAPFCLKRKPALEQEKEFILELVLVPSDAPTVDDCETE